MYIPFEQLSGDARVWIYMSDREWSADEVEALRSSAFAFVNGWTAHQQPLQASFVIRYNCFLIVAVDEQAVPASGCSIDKCVAFVKGVEQQFGVSMMNRMLFAYKKDDRVVIATKDEFERLIENDMISDQTIVYDNLVDSVHALNHRWQIPFERSWHKVLVG